MKKHFFLQRFFSTSQHFSFLSFFFGMAVRRLLSIDERGDCQSTEPPRATRRSSALDDVTVATFLDVAVVRCLMMPRWSEEGVHWALQFLFYRWVSTPNSFPLSFFLNYKSQLELHLISVSFECRAVVLSLLFFSLDH